MALFQDPKASREHLSATGEVGLQVSLGGTALALQQLATYAPLGFFSEFAADLPAPCAVLIAAGLNIVSTLYRNWSGRRKS